MIVHVSFFYLWRENLTNGQGQQDFLKMLTTYLSDDLGCHTAILYGSRARDDWDEASDIDVIAFRDGQDTGQIAHRWQNYFLDLFIYPTSTQPDEGWLRINGGRVLFEQGTKGDDVLSAVSAMFCAGPEKLTPLEAQTYRLWYEKMLTRAEKRDPEGDYRRHWLLKMLLEYYFALRGQWYLGPKRSLGLLQRNQPGDYKRMLTALEPNASLEDIRTAVWMVIQLDSSEGNPAASQSMLQDPGPVRSGSTS